MDATRYGWRLGVAEELRRLVRRVREAGVSEGCLLAEDSLGPFMLCIGTDVVRDPEAPVLSSAQAVRTPFGVILRVRFVVCDMMPEEGVDKPLALEAWLDPEKESDRALWLRLAGLGELRVFFTDREGNLVRPWGVRLTATFIHNEEILRVVDEHNEKYRGQGAYDYEKAKEWATMRIPLMTLEDAARCVAALRRFGRR